MDGYTLIGEATSYDKEQMVSKSSEWKIIDEEYEGFFDRI